MKRIITKSITVITIMAVVLALAMPMQAEAAKKPKLNKTKISLNVKKSYQLKVEGTSAKVTWSSSNKKVATVSKNGKVTGKKKARPLLLRK